MSHPLLHTSPYLNVCTFTPQNSVSPLYTASQKGHTDIVDLLLKAGADVHQAQKVGRHVHIPSNDLLIQVLCTYTVIYSYVP